MRSRPEQLLRLRIVLDVETMTFAQLSAPPQATQADTEPTEPTERSPTRPPRRPSTQSITSLQQPSTTTTTATASATDETRRAIQMGQSEERVQALSMIMLHLCTGLQFAQGVATQ